MRDLTPQLKQTTWKREKEGEEGKKETELQEGRSIKSNLRWQLYLSVNTSALNNLTPFSPFPYPFLSPASSSIPGLSLWLWLYEL